jgi:hypothetical protein
MPSPNAPQKPTGWSTKHDDFISRHARNGEDATSIAILCEVEFPKVKCQMEWVKRRLAELNREGGRGVVERG